MLSAFPDHGGELQASAGGRPEVRADRGAVVKQTHGAAGPGAKRSADVLEELDAREARVREELLAADGVPDSHGRDGHGEASRSLKAKGKPSYVRSIQQTRRTEPLFLLRTLTTHRTNKKLRNKKSRP